MDDETSLPEDQRCALNAAMDRYADGDAAAFEQVYDLLSPRLLSFFHRQLGDAALAEDFVQHTLLQMHGARRNYQAGSDVLPWALAIGGHVMCDHPRPPSASGLHRIAAALRAVFARGARTP